MDILTKIAPRRYLVQVVIADLQQTNLPNTMDNKDVGIDPPFRPSCFSTKRLTRNNSENANEDEVHHMEDLVHLVEYTKSYDHQERLLSNQEENEGNDTDDHSYSSSHEKNDIFIETGKELSPSKTFMSSQEDEVTIKRDKSMRSNPDLTDAPLVVSQNKSIEMLEPHLIGFRKILKEEGHSDIDDIDDKKVDLTTMIPLSLIRVARFFPFKWIPIKTALLRPPLPSEVEIGLNTRLSLARTLYRKGILAGAEIYELEEACQKLEYYEKEFATNKNTKKRKRNNENEVTLRDKLRVTFARLPIDLTSSTTANAALRYMKNMIDEYCNVVADINGKENALIPLPDQVVDWAFIAFNAVVLSNGFEIVTKESLQYQVESKMVSILQSYCVEGDTVTKFGNALRKRLKELMEPELLEQASRLNHFCLIRYFSYLPIASIVSIFVSTIENSYESSCDIALSILPKIIASYVSIVSHQQTLLFDDFERTLRDHLKERNKHEKVFYDLLFQTTNYLLHNSVNVTKK